MAPLKASKDRINLLKEGSNFEELADSLHDIVARFDKSCRHLFVNKVIEKITGKSRDEFIGKSNGELGMPPDLVELWDGSIRKVFETGQPVSREFSYTTPEGPKNFHILITPEFDAQEKVMTVLSICRDITAKKNSYDKTIISTRNSSVAQVCAQISHQINNPLTVIAGRVSLLEKELSTLGGDAESTLRHFTSMKLAIARIDSVIKSMAKLTGVQNIAKSDLADFSVSEVIRAVLELCEERDLAKGVRKEIMGNTEQIVHTRFSDLGEALLAVFVNALEAARSKPEPWIKIIVENSESDVIIKVVDAGNGIHETHIDQVMVPFYTTKGPQYLGLGLSTAKASLAAIGGRINYAAAEPHTTFVVSIPTN